MIGQRIGNSHSTLWGWLGTIVAMLLLASWAGVAHGQTANGEIEGRAAPVARRQCVGGPNGSSLCNENSDCPGSTCVDRNVFNLTIAIHFNATAAQLTVVQNAIRDMSAMLMDVTDGQAEIGQATIYNNAFGTAADIRIYTPAAGAWWSADTGNWKTGGSIHVSYDNIVDAPDAGESFAHEFVHLVFDARDEYETRPAGCGSPPISGFDCPHATTIASGEQSCLMDDGGLNAGDPGTELCWGQGDSTDLTAVTGGNHDANNVTEQSRCRSNRSCWDQVAWSWPNTMLKPAAAPVAGTGGAATNPVNFITVDNTVRVVLVLDESGSMSQETPSRLDRLQVAANDFITLAETGSEVGIVSFSTNGNPASGHAEIPVSALGANRTAWTTAIAGLSPDGRTNVGDALERARNMIVSAGGVTANTAIILMTDGLNNEPWPDHAADLDAELDNLLTAGIPVYVTCTGSDLGLDSQCSEIAAATAGFYVDSADASNLPEAFIDFAEKAMQREPAGTQRGTLKDAGEQVIFVEEGAHSVTFTLTWDHPKAVSDMVVFDPDGQGHDTLRMPQGRYLRVVGPKPGEWKMVVKHTNDLDANFVARAYIKSQAASLHASVRHPYVLPGGEIYLYAHPRWSGQISNSVKALVGEVVLPDGSRDTVTLHDKGRLMGTGGDDIEDDGIYTGVYKGTALKGAYTFSIKLDAKGWHRSGDARERKEVMIPRFVREARLSAVVGDPKDTQPEAPKPDDPTADCPDCPEHQTDSNWCLYVVILLSLLLVIVVILCARRRHKTHLG